MANIDRDRIALFGSKERTAVCGCCSPDKSPAIEFVELQLKMRIGRRIGTIEVLRQHDKVELSLIHPVEKLGALVKNPPRRRKTIGERLELRARRCNDE